jgi:hypothetical protein
MQLGDPGMGAGGVYWIISLILSAQCTYVSAPALQLSHWSSANIHPSRKSPLSLELKYSLVYNLYSVLSNHSALFSVKYRLIAFYYNFGL